MGHRVVVERIDGQVIATTFGLNGSTRKFTFTEEEFEEVVATHGLCLIGETPDNP